MAWYDLTFDFGSTLTASKMTGLQENFTGLANDDSGSPAMSGRANKGVLFSGQGSIIASRGISSITYTATGRYAITPTTTFSVGQQTSAATPSDRPVFSALVGFTKNVAYSDTSVRVLRGYNPSSNSLPMFFKAGNASATAQEEVDEGLVIILQ